MHAASAPFKKPGFAGYRPYVVNLTEVLKLWLSKGDSCYMISSVQALSPWQSQPGSLAISPMSENTSTEVDVDAQLMYRVAAGDEGALTLLIEKWKNPLVNFFYRSLHSQAEAEDLAQLVFIKIYRAAERYEARAKFSTFLFHIARRVLLNEFRRQKRKPMAYEDPHDLRNDAVSDPEVERRRRELEEAFQAAIVQVPEKHRTALLLYKQQQLSYQEIAESMDASENAVKTWIFRARTQLKELLKEWR